MSEVKNSAWLNDKKTQQIFNLLDGDKQKIMAVGGIVRDTILNKLSKNNDIDFATKILPKEVMKRAKNAGLKAFPTGIEHGTITLLIENKSFEVTTLRQDIKTDGRHAEVSFGNSWLDDAKRRDFTMNALYVSSDGTLFDPLKTGVQDCQNKRVRFIGDANKRLNEDKLRFFRFFRFSASHGKQNFDENGLNACKNIAKDLGNISAERIGAEMMKMLSLKQIAKTFDILLKMEVFTYSQEILDYFYHYEDIAKEPEKSERLALLLKKEEPNILQKKWRLSNAQIKKSLNILKIANLLSENEIYNVAYQISLVKINKISALNVASSIFNWENILYEKTQKKLEEIIVPPFPLSGKDLMDNGFISGENLGKALNILKEEWIKNKFKLSKDELILKLKNS